jgi:hypothetical protein
MWERIAKCAKIKDVMLHGLRIGLPVALLSSAIT